MKKTVNVNIGGMMFHLDEDAFEKCKTYLDTLKTKFAKMEGGDEIIGDIESRIAEIFKEKLSNTREVVSLQDVEDMVAIMGDPGLFLDEEGTDIQQPITENQSVLKRRLFRDPEKRVLGGVCSGFGAYFNVDPWVVRIIMICLVLFAGVSFLLYFIFWIAMPKAVTTTDRLMMRGKKVDVNSIEESVKKEWNETKSGIKNAGRNANSSAFIRGIGKFVRIAMGTGLIFFSTLTLGMFLWTMFSPTSSIHINQLHLSAKEAAGLVFDSFGEMLIAYISVWLLVVIPSVLFIYLGIRLILQFKHKLRYVMLGGFLLWMVGLVMGIYVIVGVAESNKMEASLKENPTLLLPDSATVKLSVTEGDNIPGYELVGYPIENVNLDILKNSTDSFPTLEVTRRSQGRDKQLAYTMAQKIKYYYQIEGNEIKLASYFMLNKADKFRGQEVNIKLMLPVGYKVYLAKGTDAVINGISNVQRVFDSEMPEHTWTMTPGGLSCDDCPADIIRTGEDEEDEEDEDEDSDTNDPKIKTKINGEEEE
jgi:phage shock protein PspC (stress-responsive transcriptional regulator)